MLLVGLVVISPLLFASGGFFFLPESGARLLMSKLEPLSSIPRGLLLVTSWQGAVLLGWLVLHGLYYSLSRLAISRTSLTLAVMTLLLGLWGASCLLDQQKLISIAVLRVDSSSG